MAANEFARDNHSFTGWNTSSDGLGTGYEAGQAVDRMSLTLYAQWKIDRHKVYFDSDGGTPVEIQTVDHGEKATRPADPTKDGATFTGWYLDDEEYDFDTDVTGELTLRTQLTQSIPRILLTQPVRMIPGDLPTLLTKTRRPETEPSSFPGSC